MVTTSPAASTTRLCASVARARNRRGEKRGIDRRLTGVATVASGSSGRRQGGHTVAGDLGGRSLKKRSGKPLQGASARVAWRGRCRGQRWSFWNWRKGEGGLVAVAMANSSDGDSRVSSGKGVRGGREGAASEGEVRGGRGGAWRHRGVEEEAGGGQGKQEVAEASRARATPRSFWRGGRRQGEWRWAGPCWAR